MRHPSGLDDVPRGEESNDREAEELSKLVGFEAGRDTPSSVGDSGQANEAPLSLRETQTPTGGGLRQPASATTARAESPKGENASETSKSPEQSENVIENKGPAAAKVRG